MRDKNRNEDTVVASKRKEKKKKKKKRFSTLKEDEDSSRGRPPSAGSSVVIYLSTIFIFCVVLGNALRGTLTDSVQNYVWTFIEGVVSCSVMWVTFTACSFTQFWIQDFESLEGKWYASLYGDLSNSMTDGDRSDSETLDDGDEKKSLRVRLERDFGFPPEVSKELECILDLFIRDFINEWFRNVSDNSEFPDAVEDLLVKAVVGIRKRVDNMEKSGGVLRFMNEAISLFRNHLYWYREMSALAREEIPSLFYAESGAALEPNEFCSAGLLALREDAIVEQYRSKQHLHPACETDGSEIPYLRHLSECVIQKLLHPEVPRTVDCDVVRLFVREVLCGTVLKNIMDMAAPCEANYWIDYAISIGSEVVNNAEGSSWATDDGDSKREASLLADSSDSEEDEASLGSDESRVWNFLNPNVDREEAGKILEPYATKRRNGTFLLRQADGVHLVLCYVAARRSDAARSPKNRVSVICETTISCADGEFRVIFRESDEGTKCVSSLGDTAHKRLSELLKQHRPLLTGGLRFARDLYNNRAPVKLVSFPFKEKKKARKDETCADETTAGASFPPGITSARKNVQADNTDGDDAGNDNDCNEDNRGNLLGKSKGALEGDSISSGDNKNSSVAAVAESPEVERRRLVNSLTRALEAIILNSVSNPFERFDLRNDLLVKLVVAIDAVLAHGLLQPCTSQFAHTTGTFAALRGGYSACFGATAGAEKHDGREWCSRWILGRMVDKSIGSTIQEHIADEARLKTFYSEHALVFHTPEMMAVVNMLHGIQTIHVEPTVVTEWVEMFETLRNVESEGSSSTIALSNAGAASLVATKTSESRGGNDVSVKEEARARKHGRAESADAATTKTTEKSRVDLHSSEISDRVQDLISTLQSAVDAYVVNFVKADPQPACYDVTRNLNLGTVVRALDAVLSDGLVIFETPPVGDDGDDYGSDGGARAKECPGCEDDDVDNLGCIGGYYDVLALLETTTTMTSTATIASVEKQIDLPNIRRWMCRSLSAGSVADRLRELSSHRDALSRFYSKKALIADSSAFEKIVSVVEMLNAVTVRVSWGRSVSNHGEGEAGDPSRLSLRLPNEDEVDPDSEGGGDNDTDTESSPRRDSKHKAGEALLMPVKFLSTQLNLPFFNRGDDSSEDEAEKRLPFRRKGTHANPLAHDFALTATVYGVKQEWFSDQKKWLYQISVRCDALDKEWTISRRFSYFVNLYKELKSRHPGLRVKAPDKKALSTYFMMKGRKYGRFVEHRRQRLNEFIADILASPHACDDPLVRDFLSPDVKDISASTTVRGGEKYSRRHYDSNADETDSSSEELLTPCAFDSNGTDVTVFGNSGLLDTPLPSTPVPTQTTPRSRPRVGGGDLRNVVLDQMSNGHRENLDAPSRHGAIMSRGTLKRRVLTRQRRRKSIESIDNLMKHSSSANPDDSTTASEEKSKKSEEVGELEATKETGESRRHGDRRSGQRQRGKQIVRSSLSPRAAREIVRSFWGLFKELFELYDSSWLHQRTISVLKTMATTVLQGSTYRTVKNRYDAIFSRDSALFLALKVRNKMWPNGVYRETPPDYTIEEKVENRRKLMRNLSRIVPGTISSLLGQKRCDDASMKLWEFLQSPVLLKNFAYALLDLFLRYLLRVPSQVGAFRERNRRKQLSIQQRLLRRTTDVLASSASSTPSHLSGVSNFGSTQGDMHRRMLVEQAARKGRDRALRRRSVMSIKPAAIGAFKTQREGVLE